MLVPGMLPLSQSNIAIRPLLSDSRSRPLGGNPVRHCIATRFPQAVSFASTGNLQEQWKRLRYLSPYENAQLLAQFST